MWDLTGSYPEALGVDLLDAPEVDVVGNVFDVLRMLPESSVTAVYSDHFFEHIENTDLLMKELARVVVVWSCSLWWCPTSRIHTSTVIQPIASRSGCTHSLT